MTQASAARPLEGIRVIEFGQLLAGPFAGALLAYYGAEVIKVETPGVGDPLRNWRVVEDGVSLWWRSLARNKLCVTLDLKISEGQSMAKELIASADVLIENFRPGTMEQWGLGPEVFAETQAELIYTRISGYGQSGPNKTKPGFASVCEGFSGFRYVNGFPGQAPVRPNLSLGDSLAGLHAAFGILLALQGRQQPQGRGQVVDVALYEAMYNMMEGVVPEYDGAEVIRQPSGTTVTGIVPTNTYRCSDDKYIVIGGNGDSIFKRLMSAIGREDMATDERLGNNAGRVEHEAAIDKALAHWCSGLPCANAIAVLEKARVPAGPIYSVEDMLEDPHYQARGMFEEVSVGDKTLKVPAMCPKLSHTPGKTQWAGAALGEHNAQVYGDLLGIGADALLNLQKRGVI